MVTVYTAMAYIVTAYVATASYGLYSYGPRKYGSINLPPSIATWYIHLWPSLGTAYTVTVYIDMAHSVTVLYSYGPI